MGFDFLSKEHGVAYREPGIERCPALSVSGWRAVGSARAF